MNTKPVVPRLDEADLARLNRVRKRRSSRQNPAKVPARLTRTSAFAAKRRGLITDSGFEKLYIVPGHSAVRVKGRELGTQHRDVIYAIFRLKSEKITTKQEGRHGLAAYVTFFEVKTTWRDVLIAMGLTAHTNNIAGLLCALEDIKQVVVTVYEGDEQRNVELWRAGKLPSDPGRMGNLIQDIEWEGIRLDDRVRIVYGDWTADMIRNAKLVSLNADVQFALNSDYAKAFWPFIDGMTMHTWIDEGMLAHLVGRNLWEETETSATRSEFRKVCRKAFEDMQKAGGLVSWRVEIRGVGRKKTHRYYYVHRLRKEGDQLELPIDVSHARDDYPNLLEMAG